MGLRCGIVGLPNVGKSTLFNALTAAGAEASNYPFCTIEPNTGMVKVPDSRLDELAGIVNPERVLPAVTEIVDIAGLVAGASEGEGLGNKFLGHIKEVDAILHVVRCFEEEDVVHVHGSPDPIRDIEIIETELILKDLETVEKSMHRSRKGMQTPEGRAEHDLLGKVKKQLEEGRWLGREDFSEKELEILNPLFLISMKPVLYVANISEKDIGNEDSLPTVLAMKKRAEAEGNGLMTVCSRIEAEISELESPEEKREFLDSVGLQESGLDVLIRASFGMLGLMTYFTAGVKEVRAWTIRRGMKAPQAAGVIHTDFERGFIKAEVVAFKDYLDCQGEAGAKEKGLLRIEGKEYVVQDGDIMHFRFNV